MRVPDRQSRLAGRVAACARWAEKAMRPGENARPSSPSSPTISRQTGNGWARLADAYAATRADGRCARCRAQRLGVPDLGATDEQAIWSRYGGSFTRADHDRRADACCSPRRPTTRPASSLPSPRTPGGLRGPDRDAAGRLRRREPIPGGDRQRDQRRRTDDGPRALPPRPQLRQARPVTSPPAPHNFIYRPADPGPLLRDAAPACERRGTGPAMADRLSASPASSTMSSRREPRSATSRSASATITPASPGSGAASRSTGMQPARRTRSRCSTAMRAPAARSRCRPRAIIGLDARRSPPGSSRTRTAISSAPRPIRSCSTANWRWSGSAGPFRRRRRHCRNM